MGDKSRFRSEAVEIQCFTSSHTAIPFLVQTERGGKRDSAALAYLQEMLALYKKMLRRKGEMEER